ncbi:pilus assembly protein [Ralstonia flatus]|uniref:Uncharacterized protein n=1 Tax=Ralstonia flatus TaxID=3058601 RepID=A0AAD2BX65_9RALS|nr:pilus assembly protein [Ralstonia sp. LMG 32965]MBN6211896.1 pilus assembly protein [Ralstonia pickettii]CAJ0866286.1 hypothetical protein R77567_02011 [Ralstonia sp. LMG 32965]CAJ0873725.1 hypothetical protein R77564_01968 [Ralstonia sp. LMG 32965]
MKTKITGNKRKSIGAAGIEYALLLTFVALAMAGFRLSVKTSTGAIWNKAATGLSSMASSGHSGGGGSDDGNGNNGNGNGNGSGHGHHGD